MTPRRYLVETYGCQMNEHDSQRLAGVLEADGMVPADGVDDADVVVFNTCCVRENADNRLYGNLGHLKSAKGERPDLQIAVAGCLAQKDRDLVRRRAPHVDVVLGTHNVGRVAELLAEARVHGPTTEIVEESEAFPSALPVRRELGHAAWVTIQIGCDNTCAFCIVPAVRGREISRPLDEVEAEVAQLAAGGVTEVTLLGQNVNSYGRDLMVRRRRAGETVKVRPQFAELVRRMGRVAGIRRVRFTSPHPKDLTAETIEAMAAVPAVCEHLHLPLQAGSDRTLRRMHRGYTAGRYLERLATARAAVDDLAVTTDLIVGFPGESDDDFAATLEVVAEARFDAAYTFIYSPRPGTEAAARTTDFVAPEVAVDRLERLKVVVERSALAANRARLGRIEEVVVEGPSRKDPTVVTARTRQNRLVHYPTDGASARPGTYALVEITAAAPHHLVGEQVEVVGAPRHRTRIPVSVG